MVLEAQWRDEYRKRYIATGRRVSSQLGSFTSEALYTLAVVRYTRIWGSSAKH